MRTLVLFSFFLFACVPFVSAELRYVSGIELVNSYDSNIYLSPDNEKEDYRNILNINLGAISETSVQNFNASYHLNFNKFWRYRTNDYIGHAFDINFLRHISRKLSFNFSDTYYLSEEPLEQDPEITALRRQRNRYARNRAEIGIDYKLGRESYLSLSYLDSRLQNRASDVEDSVEYGPIITLKYWINTKHGVELGYSWNRIEYEETAPLKRDTLITAYNYRFSPHTLGFINYNLEFFHAYDERDYNNHTITVGMEHAFSPRWSVGGSVGEFFWDPEYGDSKSGFVYELHVTRNFANSTITASGSGGSREEYTDAESRGFTKYNSLTLVLLHNLTARTKLTLQGSYHHDKTLNRQFQRDDIWNFGGGISYRLFRWLTCSFDVEQRERNSSDPDKEYSDFIAMISFKGNYEWR